MSIKEISEKIKPYVSSDRWFLGVVAILMAGISFGIGRLSMSVEMTIPSKLGEESFSIESIQGTSSQLQLSSSTIDTNVLRKTTAEQEPLQSQNMSNGNTYVGSKNSTKYHLPWCSGAKRIKEENKVWFSSKEDAEAKGYAPAGNCKGI